MISIIYAMIMFIATFLGASAGLGGGVIIKPVLDFIGAHDINTISFLSTSAVFSMAVYATIKQIRNKVRFDYPMIIMIAIGAILGGNVGSSLFSMLLTLLNNQMLIFLQASMLAILLLVVLINVNVSHKTLHIQHKFLICIIGFFLGLISSFLGIGGGPMNVAVFIFFFSIDMKTATVYSIATILFSQASKLITIATTTGFGAFDLCLLLYTLPMALLGAILGTKLNHIAKETTIQHIFNITVVCIILLNVCNAITAII